MAYIPFRERLWCSPAEACQVLGLGKTTVFGKIGSGEIVSRKEGRLRRIHVPSLIARYDLDNAKLEMVGTPPTSGLAPAPPKR